MLHLQNICAIIIVVMMLQIEKWKQLRKRVTILNDAERLRPNFQGS